MSTMPTISCLLLLASLLAPIDGFGVQPKGSLSSLLSENSRRRSSLSYQNEESPTSSVPTSVQEGRTESKKNEKTIDDWDLREDWALQDSVPNYTVGTEAATFWTQLRHSTPELAKRSEAALEERYKEWYSSEEDSMLVECGPSPVLLSDWRVSTGATLPSASLKKKSITTTMMSGSLPNGSQIWFPLKCAGTLGDDSMMSNTQILENPITQDTLDDCFISASLTMHMSGYAESTGGVVYELGAPRCETHKIHGPRDGLDASMGITSIPDTASHSEIDSDDIGGHLGRLHKHLVSEASKNVGTISAIVVASTMSACLTLGFANSHVAVSPSVTQNRQGDVVEAKADERIYFSKTAEGPELTISEKRARAELKVGRDKRNMVVMQDYLQKDEANLEELRKEEYRLEAAEWGFK